MPLGSLPQPEGIIVHKQRPSPRPGLSLNVWRVNVLLVEDDAADSELIQRALKRHPDIGTVTVHSSPIDALDQLHVPAYRPTLILLDIHMPKIDGFQFLELMREIPEMADVPVVFLTTSRSVRDVEGARGSTACGYLIKPDRYEELEAALHNLLKQAVAGKGRK